MRDRFEDAPKSFAERRAEAARDCALWTPRDVLINTLRRLDRGEMDPERLICIYRENLKDDPKLWSTHYVVTGSDIHATLGMMEHVKAMLLED